MGRKRQTAARISVTSKRPFGSVIISETSKVILSQGRNTTLTIAGRLARSCQAHSRDDLYRNREARTYLNARRADGGRRTEVEPVGSGSISASAQDKDE